MDLAQVLLEKWMREKEAREAQRQQGGFGQLANILGPQQPAQPQQPFATNIQPAPGTMQSWGGDMPRSPQQSQLQRILGLPSQARETGLELRKTEETRREKRAAERRKAEKKLTKVSPGTQIVDAKGNVIHTAPGKPTRGAKKRIIKGRPGDTFFNERGETIFQVPGGPTEVTEEAKFQLQLDKFRASQESKLRQAVLTNFGFSQFTGLKKEDREKVAKTTVIARHHFDAGDTISTAVLKATQQIEQEYGLLNAIPQRRGTIAGLGGNLKETESTVAAALTSGIPTSKILDRLIAKGWDKEDAIALMRRIHNAI